MKNLIHSVKISLRNRNWNAALFNSLVLPDICGKIDSPRMGSQARYVQWFKEFVEPKYTIMLQDPDPKKWEPKNQLMEMLRSPGASKEERDKWKKEILEFKPPKVARIFLSGNDCYALRCAALHEGSNDISSGHKARERVESFCFIAPVFDDAGNAKGPHNNMVMDVLQLRVDIFCQDIVNGVEEWISEKNPNIPPLLKIVESDSVGISFGEDGKPRIR